MDLLILTTGGTIDKVYFDAKSAYEVGEPLAAEILRTAGVTLDVGVEALMAKDSLEMEDADRERVAERVLAAEARHIVVTHGTDTMAATARVVADRMGEAPDRTVVFVGSLTPARFRNSDAEFNIGFAMAAAQALPPGAYVAMNGRIFDPHDVRKNRDANRFEPAP